MERDFHWRFTKEKVKGYYWRVLAELQDSAKYLMVEFNERLHHSWPDGQG